MRVFDPPPVPKDADQHYVMEKRYTSKGSSPIIAYIIAFMVVPLVIGTGMAISSRDYLSALIAVAAACVIAGIAQLIEIGLQMERNQRVTNEILIRMARRSKPE